jgi:hypothetical protein
MSLAEPFVAICVHVAGQPSIWSDFMLTVSLPRIIGLRLAYLGTDVRIDGLAFRQTAEANDFYRPCQPESRLSRRDDRAARPFCCSAFVREDLPRCVRSSVANTGTASGEFMHRAGPFALR